MKRFSEQLKKKSDSIRLRASERAELRERLTTYLEYHPLPAELKQATTQKASAKARAIESQPFSTVSLSWSFIRGAMASMAVVTLVAVPMMAERSTPGDVLYPVKVEFNEELRSKLALSPYQKIEWETTRLERRIAEARVLASEGKLTEEVEASVAAAVREQSQKTKEEISKLRSTNEDDAAIAEIELASMLAVQNELIENTVFNQPVASSDGATEKSATGSSLASVVAEESAAANATQASAMPSFEKLIARVESETTYAYELFASVKEYASPAEVASVERRLQDIDRKVAEALALVTVPEVAPEPPVNDPADAATATESTNEPVVAETGADELVDVPLTETATDTLLVPTEAATSADAAMTELENENETTTTTDDSADGSQETSIFEAVDSTTEVAMEDREAARELMRSALSDVRKLITFMTNIDVRETVSIDELVPVTLTTDERRKALRVQLNTLTATQGMVATRLETATVNEKAVTGFSTFTRQLETVVAQFNEGESTDLDDLEQQVNELSALAADIKALVPATETDSSTTDETSAEDEEVVEEIVDNTTATGTNATGTTSTTPELEESEV